MALSKGADWGWTGYRVLGLVTASAILLALFVVIELEVDQPLLNVRLFKIWSFSNSLLMIGVFSSAFFTIIFYFPLFMQHGQGISPLTTGMAMLPEALTMFIALPVAGWAVLQDRGALSADLAADPRIVEMGQHGPQGLIPYYQLWHLRTSPSPTATCSGCSPC